MAEWPKANNHHSTSSSDDKHDDGYNMLYSMRRRTRQEVQTGEATYRV
jgi:hypothetical protein